MTPTWISAKLLTTFVNPSSWETSRRGTRRAPARPLAILLAVTGCVALIVGASAPPEPIARVIVWKKVNTAAPGESFFLPVDSAKPTAAGFIPVADYASRTLFRGPESAATALLADLKAAGDDADLASDLDSFSYHDFVINSDTGEATPEPVSVAYTPSGAEGLYFVTLEGYPTEAWTKDLASRNVRILEGLAPATYIARGPRSVIASLRASTSYVRGVFPLQPSLKPSLFGATPPPEAFRWVSIRASEESPADSIRPFLDSVSQEPVEEIWREPGKVRYEALLSDLDISTLINFEYVYEVTPTRQPVNLSSERQAVLITRTDAQAGTLPATSPNYISYITAPGKLTWTANTFDNTVVGLIDTGFDNGNISLSGIQPDFKFNFGGTDYATIVGLTNAGAWGVDKTDKDGHATITSSAVTGYVPSGQRGENGYRYGLGTAPTVRIAVDKMFQCGLQGNSFSDALFRLGPSHPNVVNLSWNVRADRSSQQGGSGCAYSAESQTVDTRTRDPLLFTVSAGNGRLPDDPGQSCPTTNTVRAPATSKNGIAVGATENYTIGWSTLTSAGTCLYNGYPPAWSQPQNANNVAYYSAQRDTQSMVKPDIVAPGSRITGPFTRGTLCYPPYGITCSNNVDNQGGVQYAFSAGTSFSAPAAAGAAAVVRKWYRNLKSADPSPAMAKAILINGARDVAGAWVRNQYFVNQTQIGHIPDPYQGWGMLSLDRLLGPSSQYYFFDQGVQLSGTGSWLKTLYIVNGTRPTHLTLVWTDVTGGTGTHYIITNNLELQAAANGGLTLWYSNKFGSSGYSLANSPNHDAVNNVEQIIIAPNSLPTGAPLYVSVAAVSLPGGNQDFAIMADNAHE